MRPKRLELEGFTTFREKVIVDFDDAHLFALTGPTGAGKSSVIDAMVFALYGSIPRYGNEGLIHPVVSQGLMEAKVRFDFTAAGRDYTAVRVVRRTKNGATTKEARLECGGETRAGNARELTHRIEHEVLGLSFSQFTTCVVLPQGEFARFLNDEPSKRQDLLVRLLGLGLYERMASIARSREVDARNRAQLYTEQLADLQFASDAAQEQCQCRLDELTSLHAEVDAARPELDRLQADVSARSEEAKRLTADVVRLEALRVPAGVAELSRKLVTAREQLQIAVEQTRVVGKRTEKLEATRAALGESDALAVARRDREQQADATQQLELERATLLQLTAASEKHATRLAATIAAQTAAQEALDAARRDHAAHDLRTQLVTGEPCPVCQQVVEKGPKVGKRPAVLSKAEKQLEDSTKQRAKDEEALRAEDRRLTQARQVVATREQSLVALQKRLAKAPSTEEIDARLAAIDVAQRKLEQHRLEDREGRRREHDARTALETLESRAKTAWKDLDSARDRVGSLAPPPVDRENLAQSWSTLQLWATEQVPALRARATALIKEIEGVEGQRAARRAALVELCKTHGVDVGKREPWTALVDELGAARAELTRVADALTKATELRAKCEVAQRAALVAASLSRHLRADGFERWLLEAAFQRLVTSASVVLRELSSEQYSLAYDERLTFEVVDHRNADERRSTRTLSGGETFLASLALALTLAEQVQELAAEGSAPLESIFLDEGFGTLDPHTLDTVATAIEDLGERGRVVGIVTHVAELAERTNVQFRVDKGPTTSTVTRVS